jgi:hypothetical protein
VLSSLQADGYLKCHPNCPPAQWMREVADGITSNVPSDWADDSEINLRPARKRKRRTISERKLTAKQSWAGELWEKHHHVKYVAIAMGISRSTAGQHLARYWQANPASAPQPRRQHKRQSLPTDERGQVATKRR